MKDKFLYDNKRYVIKTFSIYIQENYTLERNKNRLEQII